LPSGRLEIAQLLRSGKRVQFFTGLLATNEGLPSNLRRKVVLQRANGGKHFPDEIWNSASLLTIQWMTTKRVT